MTRSSGWCSLEAASKAALRASSAVAVTDATESTSLRRSTAVDDAAADPCLELTPDGQYHADHDGCYRYVLSVPVGDGHGLGPSMGWVGLGWFAFSSTCEGLGWVEREVLWHCSRIL